MLILYILLDILLFTVIFGGISFYFLYSFFPNFSLKKKITISCCVVVAGSLMTGILIVGIEKLDNHSSHNTQSKYDTDLDNGLDKMINGETMTEDEENAVNDFYEWNDEQYRNK